MTPESPNDPSEVIRVGETPAPAAADTAAIRRSYAAVLARIHAAAQRAGRDAAEIALVAVSKGKPLEVVETLYRSGHREFGENRVEEGSEKTHAARRRFAPEVDAITWHMIGHVQSRKARLAAADFDYIQSVDSVKLARRLARAADELGRVLPVLLECNVSGEASKYGFAADEYATDAAQQRALREAIEQIATLSSLSIRGLMTMAPIGPEPEAARPYFKALRKLRDALAVKFPALTWDTLSMGMTDDFEVAIEEGATIIRVGRAIFGERAL